MTPATSPDEGAGHPGGEVLDLTDAERRQAKRDELRGEHEKSQLQLMRLLDQIREVRMTYIVADPPPTRVRSYLTSTFASAGHVDQPVSLSEPLSNRRLPRQSLPPQGAARSKRPG